MIAKCRALRYRPWHPTGPVGGSHGSETNYITIPAWDISQRFVGEDRVYVNPM